MTGPPASAGAAPALVSALQRAPFFAELRAGLEREAGPLGVSGLVAGARALLLTHLAADPGRPLVLVVPDDAALEAYRRDLTAVKALLGRDPRQVEVLPALDADPYGDIPAHPEVARGRVVALGRLRRREPTLLLLPVRALLQPVPPAAHFGAWTRTVRTGDELPPARFVLQALQAGYRRVDTVTAPGEVSRRGGIVDVFSPSSDEPVRIELFGDTVESLRSFDTDHQRSTGPLAEAVIEPAVEHPPTDQVVARIARHLETSADAGRDERSLRRFRLRLDRLRDQGAWPGFEALAGVSFPERVLAIDYACRPLLVVDEPEQVDEELARSFGELVAASEESGERALPPPSALFVDPVEVRRRLAGAAVHLRELGDPDPGRPELRANSRRAPTYAGKIGDLIRDLQAEPGWTSLCVMRTPGSAERLQEILAEFDGSAAESEPPGPRPIVLVGGLRHGFELPEERLRVLTEPELFGEPRKRPERKRSSAAAFLSDFRDLKSGDLVVHVDHGIARYTGLGRPKGGSLNRDFMTLEFARGDRLFIPVDRLDLVQKYRGVAGRKPSLDRLGGPGWARVKSKVRKSVESMARELLELYARRRTAKGHSFSPDGTWQRELEAAFPFDATPDQDAAIRDVKRDMESERPMDRLLVGDVGFGKTEVAVRAAFKAVMDGRQVALLTPTTVLAFQHLQTFRQRFAPFPARVEMISRFRTAREIREVLRGVESGEVDVLIGTHRLLSKDVQFLRLGLLVVDEEQRFGVGHKERLKRLAVGLDVMAMTATPIPRTLQMSLAGVRDLSVIQTPPPGRSAIQTYLVPFRKTVVAQAIRQELRREGQVFVVHDRVDTLPALARAVRELVPDARVEMAHGQMNERALERVMLRFVGYECDVLVTTTIIENGLDIPRCNTIIVNRADRFGLAQLYQLRGRVGRAAQHAYAYFLVPGRQLLSEPARRRLAALREFSELGAGFRLAAADLEIRGAGEFLGTKQHGHIASLGFDLYCQMLERAVQELQGEPVAEHPRAALHLGVDIKLPSAYMPDAGDRLALYKRVAVAAEPADLDRLQAETEDRCGHLPPAGRNLFDLARVRLVAERTGVLSVDVVEGRLQLRFRADAPLDPARVAAAVAREGGTLSPSGMMAVPAPPRSADRISAVQALLEHLEG